MKNYFKKWSFMRALRLALGIFIIVQGIQSSQWLLVLAGSLFSLIPIFNIGCCGVTGCRTPVSKSNRKMEDITYEEVH